VNKNGIPQQVEDLIRLDIRRSLKNHKDLDPNVMLSLVKNLFTQRNCIISLDVMPTTIPRLHIVKE